jgi:predicted DNA-binding transcriptional regulator YafY
MRLHRLLGIIMLLDSRGTMKACSLAKILETSERTIYRDIDILCEAGIPITAASGPKGGFSFMEGFRIDSGTLGSDDIINLLLSSMGIRADKNTETAQKLKNAAIKLENSVAQEYREEIIKAKEKFFFDRDPWWGKKPERSNSNIDIIKKAVLDLKKLRINYKKYDGSATERIIRPYGAVVKDSEWYVAAFCENRNEIRIFRCSRIENVQMMDEGFKAPEDFSLEEFWEKSKLQFKAQSFRIPENKFYPVKLKFYEEKGKLLEGFKEISFSKAGDHWIYEIDMLSFETACRMLFELCDRIEVIEPQEVRNYIIKKSEKILEINK